MTMQHVTSLTGLVGLAALAMFGLGCSGGVPDVGLVRGTVTLDGKAYPDAQVVFTPAHGRPSTGITDSNGSYVLVYLRDVKGATPGKHTVRITTVQRSTSDRGEDPPFHESIPERYNVKSTLSADVKPGENVIDFALTSEQAASDN